MRLSSCCPLTRQRKLRFKDVCTATNSLRERMKHWTIIQRVPSFWSPFPPFCPLLGLCHILYMCVCVSLSQWDSHDRGCWVRETGQSQMCRSLFPVLNGKHSPAVQPRMSGIAQISWCFNSSLFIQADGHLHTYKLYFTLLMSFLMAQRIGHGKNVTLKATAGLW